MQTSTLLTHDGRPSGRCRTQRRLAGTCAAVVVVLLALSLVAHTSPAGAATWSTTGTPGVISSTKIYGSHEEKCDTTPSNVLPGASCVFRVISSQRISVNRSLSSTGLQSVRSAYWYRWWTGSTWSAWAAAPGHTWQNSIAAGSPSVTIAGMNQIVPSGYFQVALSMTWTDVASGRVLGSKTVTFNAVGDYVCAALTPCSASNFLTLP